MTAFYCIFNLNFDIINLYSLIFDLQIYYKKTHTMYEFFRFHCKRGLSMKKKIVITFFLVLSFFVGALIVDLQKKKIETKNAILKNKSLKTIQSILDNHK